MDQTKSEHLDQPAEHSETAGRNRLRCISSFRKAILAILLICESAPRVTGQERQRHHARLWPPANIEPCLVQCPAQHVQMTGNRSSGTEMYWGPQPILDFMSNSQWQTSAPLLRPTTLLVDVTTASGITTLVTSVMAVASPARSVEAPFSVSATSMAMSGAERTLGCNIMFQVIVTLSCVTLFYNT